MQKRILSEISL